MSKEKDLIELIFIWLGVITSFITPFLPLLQLIAVVLAIAVSIKKLWPKRKNNV